jgi:hypothetical protein
MVRTLDVNVDVKVLMFDLQLTSCGAVFARCRRYLRHIACSCKRASSSHLPTLSPSRGSSSNRPIWSMAFPDSILRPLRRAKSVTSSPRAYLVLRAQHERAHGVKARQRRDRRLCRAERRLVFSGDGRFGNMSGKDVFAAVCGSKKGFGDLCTSHVVCESKFCLCFPFDDRR